MYTDFNHLFTVTTENENAGAENAIPAKMQGWKIQKWKMRE